MDEERRRFLRCPLAVPIRLRLVRSAGTLQARTGDLSEGGLYFYSEKKLEKGTELSVSVPVEGRLFELSGEVVYSERDPQKGSFRTGVSFRDPISAFRVKLAEEMLRISEFHGKLVQKEGPGISQEEAARRWIGRYAEKFSELFG